MGNDIILLTMYSITNIQQYYYATTKKKGEKNSKRNIFIPMSNGAFDNGTTSTVRQDLLQNFNTFKKSITAPDYCFLSVLFCFNAVVFSSSYFNGFLSSRSRIVTFLRLFSCLTNKQLA